jgi:CheY-like chemotaxis protein
VIVADDDADLRRLIALALRQDGHEVVEAASGAQLVDVVVKHAIYGDPSIKPADVIVSDVFMPGCSGLQVLADMRGRDWATPVVLMTAFADRHLRLAAQRLGATAVFDKPLDLSGLRSFVGRMVEEQRRGVQAGNGG